jgi:hypothetical protein
MNYGKHGKGVAERAMNNMPQMKDALCLVEKNNAL